MMGSGRASALPAPRTVHAVLPHTALRPVVSSSGLARRREGFKQGEKPTRSEEGIRPAPMILIHQTVPFASSDPETPRPPTSARSRPTVPPTPTGAGRGSMMLV